MIQLIPCSYKPYIINNDCPEENIDIIQNKGIRNGENYLPELSELQSF